MKKIVLLLFILFLVSCTTSQQTSPEQSLEEKKEKFIEKAQKAEPPIIPDVPVNAIPPLYFPEYVSVEEANVENGEFILGFEANGDSRAYPLKIMNFHEIVNEEVGGEKVLISYCPLCRSGLVFSRMLEGEEYTFGNSGALWESAMVMFDDQTESYWSHTAGRAIKGPLTGKKLIMLVSNIMTFAEWKELYPASKVLTDQLGFDRNYDRDPYQSYDRVELPPGWPISHHDDRLQPREKVLGIEDNDVYKAYSLTGLGKGVVNDAFEGMDVVVFSTETGAGFIYERELNGEILEFELVDGKIQDTKTSSTWSLSGVSLSGKLQGERLRAVPSATLYWFAWATIHPETEVYT